jgi:hypothetical protein
VLSRVVEVRRVAKVLMPEQHDSPDVATLTVARAGQVEETGDPLLPFRLVDDQSAEVSAVTEFLHHMLADNASPASLRWYSYELLAWFRFLDAVMIPWDLAGRSEARDFALWLKTSRKRERQLVIQAPWPGAGLRSWSSAASRAVSAAWAAASACLMRAAAAFLAGLGTLRSGSSGLAA